jgi:hypothetical protein
MKTPVLLLAGAALGIAIVVACGDDSPTDADAAMCDCPAAEPPLAGRITIAPNATVALSAQSNVTWGRGCDEGEILLGGSCLLETQDPEITLSESGVQTLPGLPPAWRCVWNNPTARDNVGEVRVICLAPAN